MVSDGLAQTGLALPARSGLQAAKLGLLEKCQLQSMDEPTLKQIHLHVRSCWGPQLPFAQNHMSSRAADMCEFEHTWAHVHRFLLT